MKRKYVIGIIIIVLLVVAGFAGRSIYKERYSDEMKKSLDITNSTNVKFKAIGIAWKDNVVLQKSNKNDYFIPQVLDIQENRVRMVAITEDNQLLKSDEFQFEGKLKDPEKFKEVTIKSVENKKLILNVATAKSKIKVLKIPKNYKWDQKIAVAGDNINAEVFFKAKTKYTYDLTLHGKGGRAGASGEVKGGEEAQASWVAPGKNILNSWVRFVKK